MPLWFHPPPFPVDLGAPVYPGPLLYHPSPYLVDPRSYHPYDTIYCACQFSVSPTRPTKWADTKPTAPTLSKQQRSQEPHGSKLNNYKKIEMECEAPLCGRIGTTNIFTDRKKTKCGSRVTVNFNRHVKCLQHCCHDIDARDQLHTEIRRELAMEGGKMEIPLMATLRAEIREQIKDEQAAEQHRKELVRAEMREEIRRQIVIENSAVMKDLIEREIELDKRMQAIKEKEDNWIKSYGPGILQGGFSGSTGSFRSNLGLTPAREVLHQVQDAAVTSSPTTGQYTPPIPEISTARCQSRQVFISTQSGEISGAPKQIPLHHPNHSEPLTSGHWLPLGHGSMPNDPTRNTPRQLYMLEQESLPWGHEFIRRPPPPTVYTLSSDSGSEPSTVDPDDSFSPDLAEKALHGTHFESTITMIDPTSQISHKSKQAESDDVQYTRSSLPEADIIPQQNAIPPQLVEEINSPNILEPEIVLDINTPLPDLEMESAGVAHHRHAQHSLFPIGYGSNGADATKQFEGGNYRIITIPPSKSGGHIVVTIDRSASTSSGNNSRHSSSCSSSRSSDGDIKGSTSSSEKEVIFNALRENLETMAAEYTPRCKKVHWEAVSKLDKSVDFDTKQKDQFVGNRKSRRDKHGKRWEMGIVEPALRTSYI